MKSTSSKRMPNVRIVADENIPLVSELFGRMGTVRTLPGRSITREELVDADVLLVRSVTRVDAALLGDTCVRFVGSATIGTDHIETEYLHQHEIAWASAPGSNAESVVEYVMAALLRLAVRRREVLRGKTLGVVGCGNVGGRLADRAAALGMTVLKNDPPLEASDPRGAYHSLQEVLERSDVVTCHVPLTDGGPFPTRHLIGRKELATLSNRAWLINTARGQVVDNLALVEALREGRPAAVVLDVWEDEPAPSAELVERVAIGTPHIAGYSYEGKISGTLMLLDALAEHLGEPPPSSEGLVDRSRIDVGAPDPILNETEYLHHLVMRMYDLAADDRRMRHGWPASAEDAAARFTQLRRTYPHRRSFRAYRYRAWQIPPSHHRAASDGLRVELVEGAGRPSLKSSLEAC